MKDHSGSFIGRSKSFDHTQLMDQERENSNPESLSDLEYEDESISLEDEDSKNDANVVTSSEV